MAGYRSYQFVGPLKPGQKPPPLPPVNPTAASGVSNRNDAWSILDILKEPLTNFHVPSSSSSSSYGSGSSLAGAIAGSAGHYDSSGKIGKIKKPKKFLRAAGGTTWEDPTLAEWDPNDYRAFVGDLGNDVTDELLRSTFEQYPSFVRAKVVIDRRTKKTKGYGFVSFKDPLDYAKAIKDWDGKYLGSKPIKLRKSNWRDRALEVRKSKMPEVPFPEPPGGISGATPALTDGTKDQDDGADPKQ